MIEAVLGTAAVDVVKTPLLPSLPPEPAVVSESANNIPPVTQSFSNTNPYDIEYEDYDSDDDDYGNNKRLKIDERDDLPEASANSDRNEAGTKHTPEKEVVIDR